MSPERNQASPRTRSWKSECVPSFCGHCEKLAGPLWRHVIGRDYFAIENGNLSRIGVPGLGDGLYSGLPHSEPEYMNHQQGLTLLVYAENKWFPQTVRIKDGTSWTTTERFTGPGSSNGN